MWWGNNGVNCCPKSPELFEIKNWTEVIEMGERDVGEVDDDKQFVIISVGGVCSSWLVFNSD